MIRLSKLVMRNEIAKVNGHVTASCYVIGWYGHWIEIFEQSLPVTVGFVHVFHFDANGLFEVA